MYMGKQVFDIPFPKKKKKKKNLIAKKKASGAYLFQASSSIQPEGV